MHPADPQFQYSDIYNIIISKLTLHSSPSELKSQKFTQPLQVIFLIKSPPTHTFICNLTHSIQIQVKSQRSKPIQQYTLDPFNKISNHYYSYPQINNNTNDLWKVQFTLNANDKQLIDRYGDCKEAERNQFVKSGGFNNYQPQPYEPMYYFKNNFKEFLNYRNNLHFQQTHLETIKITEWSLKIINISKSGCYGLVLQVYKYRNNHKNIYFEDEKEKKHPFELKNVGSIFYEKQIERLMQNMRLKMIKEDMMKSKDDEIQMQNEISICYHLRNQMPSHKLPKMSQFVYLDKHQQIIKFNPELQVNLIAFGQLEGMCTFPQALNLKKQEKQQSLKILNAFNMKSLELVLNKGLQDKKSKNKARKNKVGSQNFNKMIEEKLQGQFYNINLRSQNPTFMQSESDSDSLWSDSNQDNSQLQNQLPQNINNSYQQIFNPLRPHNNNQPSSQSQSSEEEQNQYFKKYREQFRRQGNLQ